MQVGKRQPLDRGTRREQGKVKSVKSVGASTEFVHNFVSLVPYALLSLRDFFKSEFEIVLNFFPGMLLPDSA